MLGNVIRLWHWAEMARYAPRYAKSNRLSLAQYAQAAYDVEAAGTLSYTGDARASETLFSA
jgi:hypothetical protein